MVTATLTTKGQITIPKVIRESLHLHSGDRIEFVLHDQSEAILKPITKSVDEVFGKLHSPDQLVRTTADMDAAVKRRMRRDA